MNTVFNRFWKHTLGVDKYTDPESATHTASLSSRTDRIFNAQTKLSSPANQTQFYGINRPMNSALKHKLKSPLFPLTAELVHSLPSVFWAVHTYPIKNCLFAEELKKNPLRAGFCLFGFLIKSFHLYHRTTREPACVLLKKYFYTTWNGGKHQLLNGSHCCKLITKTIT